MRWPLLLVALVAGVGCCGRGGKAGNQPPVEAEANQMDSSTDNGNDGNGGNGDGGGSGGDATASAPPPSASEWSRFELRDAGVSIEHRAGWATIEEKQIVYQRFSNEGAISVRWGADATIDYVLAHTGTGSGSTRAVETDEATKVDGLPARRVKLRVTSPPVRGTHPTGDPVRVFVFIGFAVAGKPVLLGYRSPASELAAVEPQLERVLASVRIL